MEEQSKDQEDLLGVSTQNGLRSSVDSQKGGLNTPNGANTTE